MKKINDLRNVNAGKDNGWDKFFRVVQKEVHHFNSEAWGILSNSSISVTTGEKPTFDVDIKGFKFDLNKVKKFNFWSFK